MIRSVIVHLRNDYHGYHNLFCNSNTCSFSFQLLGMGISAMGFFILVEKDKKVRDAVDIFFDPSILMCIAGIIIFMLGFFGCLGALRENICLLKTVSSDYYLSFYNYQKQNISVLPNQ